MTAGPPLWFAWQVVLLVYLVAREHWYAALGLALFLGGNLGMAWARSR